MAYGTYHYVVSTFSKTVLAVYGNALRELAFESAAKKRADGTDCEVFTRTGDRLGCGAQFRGSRK